MKFFHAADVHLGAVPDKGYPWSQDRSREIWNSFRRLVMQVGREKADLFLIAGDLFHRQPLMRELKEVNYLFSTIPDTEVVLIAGNHDYLKKDSCYLKFPWVKNVHGLWGGNEPCVEFPDIGTAVYGLSYDRKEIMDPLYHHITPQGRQPVEILLAHGGDDRHIPFRTEILEQAGFAYVALGHIHKPQILVKDRIAYAGALEPVDKNDIGAHGYIKGVIRNKSAKIQFVPFAERNYEILPLTLHENTTGSELRQRLASKIEEYGKENIYRVILNGSRLADLQPDMTELERLGYIREITDRTRPAYNMDELMGRYRGSLIEAYIRAFDRDNLSETEEKAFAYGIEALLLAAGE